MVKIVAHRGDSANHPDNTWAAILAAYRQDADACEIDLQCCADGGVIASHEYYVGANRFAEMNLAEARQQLPDAPVLGEIIEFAKRHDFPFLLEIKDEATLEPLARELSGCDPGLFLVGSFHGPLLMIATVIDIEDMIALARRYGCVGVHPCWEARDPYPHRLLTKESVALLRSEGLRVTLWHEERPGELEALLRLAPDAICTNDPGLLKKMRDDPIAKRP